MFVALLVERANEVFITAWFAPGRAGHDADIRRITKGMNIVKALPDDHVFDDGTRADRLLALEEKRQDVNIKLAPYKARTTVVALRVSIVLGLVTAAVGYRILAEIVDADQLTGLAASGFVFVDVLLTGGLLAGSA